MNVSSMRRETQREGVGEGELHADRPLFELEREVPLLDASAACDGGAGTRREVSPASSSLQFGQRPR